MFTIDPTNSFTLPSRQLHANLRHAANIFLYWCLHHFAPYIIEGTPSKSTKNDQVPIFEVCVVIDIWDTEVKQLPIS